MNGSNHQSRRVSVAKLRTASVCACRPPDILVFIVAAFPILTFSQMARYRQGITLLVVLVLVNAGRGFNLRFDPFELLRLGRWAVMEAMEFWDVIPRESSKVPGEDLVFMKVMERELLKSIDQISRKIDDYQERTEIKTDAILTQLLVRLPMQQKLDEIMRELDHYIGQVQGLYKVFEMYANNSDKYERYTMLQFAKTCVSPRLGELPDVLKSIHRLMVPSEQQVYDRSILVLLANQMQVGT